MCQYLESVIMKQFSDINEAIYRWYCLARQSNVLVSGPMLKQAALILAAQMGHHQFKAGWLESFKKRHNIRQFAVCLRAIRHGI